MTNCLFSELVFSLKTFIVGLNVKSKSLSKIIIYDETPNSNLPNYCPFLTVSPYFTIGLQLEVSVNPISIRAICLFEPSSSRIIKTYLVETALNIGRRLA